MDASLRREANKSVDSFRNKVVLDFSSKDIKEVLIEIAKQPETIHLLKEGETWNLEKPIQAQANEKNITTYLDDISFLRADALVDSLATPKPYLKITLNSDKVLSFYEKRDSKKTYVLRKGRQALMEVDSEEVKKNFMKQASYFKEEPPPLKENSPKK